MHYVDLNGRQIVLGRKIGTGGEGSVYEVTGAPEFVAKIYHEPATPEKAAKLAAMSQLATSEILKFAAWPRTTLHRHQHGATLGIVLPRIKNSCEVHELYSPAHRKQRFPTADWRFLIRVARNCAAAFATLHNHRIVIGDVNQANVFVSPRAMVSLIDCDSFQVQANGRLYRCPVGVAHFVPPELQNARLTNVIRTTNHDNFGLAILIFHLLFMGRHPFAGQYFGPGDMPIENAIRDFRFAYGSSAARYQMAPPPNSLTFSSLPHDIYRLFEQAFTKGSEFANARPASRTWAQSLEQLERQLRRCQDDQGHFYPTHLPRCPWCEIILDGGPNFFIAVSIRAVAGRSTFFDLQGIWAQVQAVPHPKQIFKPAPRDFGRKIVPRPVPEEADEYRTLRSGAGIVAASAGVLTVFAFLIPILAFFTIPICMVFALLWLALQMHSPVGKLRRERRQTWSNKTRELRRVQAQQAVLGKQYSQRFQSKLRSLHDFRDAYNQLFAQREAELQSLTRDVQQRQLREHLRNCFISDATISGIGQGRIAALESYGIETADDIEEWTVRNVPGFGDKMTARLMDWRRQKERDFRYQPSKGIPQADIQALEIKYTQMRSQHERRLQLGPHELRQISNAAKVELEKLDSVLVRLEYEAEQTKADLRVLSKTAWWF